MKFFLTFLFISMLHACSPAQSTTVSDDGQKLTFVVSHRTTKEEMEFADSVFTSHQVDARFRASRNKNGEIHKLKLDVKSDVGDSSYRADRFTEVQGNITVVVDRHKNAPFSICMGICD